MRIFKVTLLLATLILLGIGGCCNKTEKPDPVTPTPVDPQPATPAPIDPEPVTPTGDNEARDAWLSECVKKIIPDDVGKSLIFPEYFDSDDYYCDVTWDTTNKKTISAKGMYYKNVFDEDITITAKAVFDNEYQTECKKTVHTKGTYAKDEFLADFEKNIPDYVYGDIELAEKIPIGNNLGDVTYTSSRLDVLSDSGEYLNSFPTDQDAEISYVIAINGITVEGAKKVTVEANKDKENLTNAVTILNEKFADVTYVIDKIDLPEKLCDDRVDLTWESSDLKVISNEGVLSSFEINNHATLKATLKCHKEEETWEKEFYNFTDESIIDFVAERIHRDTLQQRRISSVAYSGIDLGYIPFYHQTVAYEEMVYKTTPNNEEIFYLNKKLENPNVSKLTIETGLVPWNNKGRPQVMKTSTEYITVHDTGDGTHSASWWNELEKTNDNRQTSWNFTVGEDMIYQHIPIDEVAWHAADGSRTFALLDTGVKYRGINPKITVGPRNSFFLYINGVKSAIPVPPLPTQEKLPIIINPAGLYTCCGENGNYYLGKVYASQYNKNKIIISTCGGNRNSIGIETCINMGIDYNQVMRNCSNLVGALLVHFNLDPSRIMQHRSFCGKRCPMVMIDNDLLPYFYKMCQTEYVIRKYLTDAKFEYHSLNPDILSDKGKVLEKITEPVTVKYTVKITFRGQEKDYQKETTIMPM